MFCFLLINKFIANSVENKGAHEEDGRQSLQGELQSLDVLGAFPALAYPEEVMQ